MDVDEALRIRDRRIAQKNSVHGAEDRRIGANAQSERRDDRRGKRRRASQPPQCISNIATGIGPHDNLLAVQHPNVTVPAGIRRMSRRPVSWTRTPSEQYLNR